MLTNQKVPPTLKWQTDCPKLSVSGWIIPFSLGQTFAEVLHWVPGTVMKLLQHSTNTIVAGVTYNTRLQRAIKNLQSRSAAQTALQGIKGTLLVITPNKWLTLASQQRQRWCNFTKSQYKFAIIITQTKELLNLVDISWHRPTLNRVNFSLFNRNSRSIHNMSQEGDTLKVQMTFAVLQIKLVLCKQSKNLV